MNTAHEYPRQSHAPQEHLSIYGRLDAELQERFGFGYQTYYMRRFIAAERILLARREAALAWNKEEQARHHETAERWEQLLLTYCQDRALLELEKVVAAELGQSWMRKEQIYALSVLGDYEAVLS